jgi:8-oxo-dGTP pyrophosphatase MutT (NUDIX family)
MTYEEQEKIFNADRFESLWTDLWQSDDLKCFMKEYIEAKDKFNSIKKGYLMKDHNDILYIFNLNYIRNYTNTYILEQEWGFPKGRRNINETDIMCALREFYEETGLQSNALTMYNNLKPVEEIFSGSNNVRYKHIYYLAKINNKHYQVCYNPHNKLQVREIKDMQWFDYDNVLEHINDANIERKELFKRVHKNILNKIL